MRAITVLVTPPASAPPSRLFREEPDVLPDRVINFNVLDDGSLVLLGRLRGDLDRVRSFLSTDPDVLGFSVSGEAGEGGLVYIHSRPPPAVRPFLTLPRDHEVFFDFPIEATTDGRYRLTVVGETNEAVQRALAAAPDEVDIEVERIGPYLGEGGDLSALLTDRQREVLAVARKKGYYEVPRRTTHRDIAAELDLSAGTVAEHLQKIEARVLGGDDT